MLIDDMFIARWRMCYVNYHRLCHINYKDRDTTCTHAQSPHITHQHITYKAHTHHTYHTHTHTCIHIHIHTYTHNTHAHAWTCTCTCTHLNLTLNHKTFTLNRSRMIAKCKACVHVRVHAINKKHKTNIDFLHNIMVSIKNILWKSMTCSLHCVQLFIVYTWSIFMYQILT